MQNDCSHGVDSSRSYFSMATAIDELSEDSTLLKPKQVPSCIRIGMDCAYASSCIADSSETLSDATPVESRQVVLPAGV
jgi:hypothetical protein